jgi:predicted NUDIX family phosphoesterase
MDPVKANELVLGFDSKRMWGFVGLLPENYPEEIRLCGISKRDSDLRWLKSCVETAYLMPRGVIEEDPSFKQIIPYVIIMSEGKIFTYCRGGAEKRLTGNYSIGIGGHINPEDLSSALKSTVTHNPLYSAAIREVYEELDFSTVSHTDRIRIQGKLLAPSYILYDPSDAVGSVHIGAVYVVTLPALAAAGLVLLEEGTEIGWLSKEELLGQSERLEKWSSLVLTCL